MNTESKHFINRELSWLAFNRRVLKESLATGKSSVERLRFSAIFSSNLDEFFMVRVGSLVDQLNADFNLPDPSGLKPDQQLSKIMEVTRELIEEQERICSEIISNELPAQGFRLIGMEETTREEMDYLKQYFLQTIYPVLTPMAIDYVRPFPLIFNKSLNIAILFSCEDPGSGEFDYATVQVPSGLPRFVPLKFSKGGRYVLIEEIIRQFISELFQGREVVATAAYRITRNADLEINDEGAEDLLVEIEASLKRRKWGEVVRLELQANADTRLRQFLTDNFEVAEGHIFDYTLFLDMTALFGIGRFIRQEKDPFKPVRRELVHDDYFNEIKHGDLFLHHPYDDFGTVVDFIETASRDKNVLAIKQVLYRVSGDSPIIKALAAAAEQGKQVTVLVELQARFDEENNIQWAKQLEKTGCHVIYGYPNLKTHAKVLLVVRKEGSGIKRYLHLSTGNYNDQTAKFYTDMGILTANESMAHDASKFFNILSGFSRDTNMEKLIMAPSGLRNGIIQMIQRETQHARKGHPAEIIAKMNSLVDQAIIEKLYEASQAGVSIRLIVRGICCLVPGVPGLSDKIQVRSIIGKYLEHSRIFWFRNHGNDSLYLSSADWMPRNLDQRIELMFPIENQHIKNRILKILELYLNGTVKVSVLEPTGVYSALSESHKGYNPQQVLEELTGTDEREFFKLADKAVKKQG